MRWASGVLMAGLCMVCVSTGADEYAFRLTVTSELTFPRTPMDPEIDFRALMREAGIAGVLDPNSIRVVDVEAGAAAPCAVTEDFAYGDKGRVEWVITNPAHREYEIGFATAEVRPASRPAAYTPLVGVGDLLRYNAGEPRPIAMPYISGLADLTGDGKPDLVGCWNYAYRPGWPWDGIVCYPWVGGGAFAFGDLVRVRYAKLDGSDGSDRSTSAREFAHFSSIYMMADFDDFDGDGLVDVVYSPRSGDALQVYVNTGRRDGGGMPVFAAGASLPRPANAWGPVRAVDLDRDGAMDLVACAVYGEGSGKAHEAFYLRNTNDQGWPMELADPVDLHLGRGPCFFDVDEDGALDAVSFYPLAEGEAQGSERVCWQRNLGGVPPAFGEAFEVEGIAPMFPQSLASVEDDGRRGLLVGEGHCQRVGFYERVPGAENTARFERRGAAGSVSAVMSLSDQAWPWPCDWDGDGDLDLLVGGGYGWPRIVVNEGTRERPAYAEAECLLSEGKPIKLVRNDLLGEPLHWHNMGYSYPSYVDWDGDGLRDLMLPNETNRIYWYRNVGTVQAPAFGPRQQLEVDGYEDSAEGRRRSAERALESTYPLEEEQPFFWRTGAAFADWNGDGLVDLATHDGHTRKLTLFVQYRGEDGRLGLKKAGPLKLADGRLIDDAIVERSAHWTESFRPVDWDGDGLMDLMYSCAGTAPAKGSIYLLRNCGSKEEAVFEKPRTMRCFGWPIKVTAHGPNAWAGDLDGDGLADLLACVEWSVYPFYTHAALEMAERPEYEVGPVARKE